MVPPADCRAVIRFRRSRSGFTLLEVILAMGVLLIIIGGLSAISGAAVRLVRAMAEAQMAEAGRDHFERLLRENLGAIEADSPVRLIGPSSRLQVAGGTGQVLVIGQASGLFSMAGVPVVVDSVALETRRNRAGTWTVNVVYYAGDYWEDLQGGGLDESLMVVVPYRDNLATFEWNAFDVAQDEWLKEWEVNGRRPHFLELIYRFAGDREDSRMVFWMPPQRAAAPGAGGPRGGRPGAGEPGDGVESPPEGGGAGVRPPTIRVPTPQPGGGGGGR